ncbi:MAG: phosphoglycerate dehydrogenase [Bdellovibrionales bacterium]|nr:phosphoglycerate dehydrogenase [Bdellovibrionales bacterium]
MSTYSFPKEKIKILLLEGIHQAAIDVFEESGYSVESSNAALSEEELLKLIPDVHLIGIRSKTRLTSKVLERAQRLLAVACFCIGTDQVDLEMAAKIGVPVFNAPYSNTRSVAELTIANIIMLARKAAYKSLLLHQGQWDKSANNCYEVRQKTLGIIGYGHIGPQVGLLAEALGMSVHFYDIEKKLPLGNAQAVKDLKSLLKASDFVSLHVPDTESTRGMIGENEIKMMKNHSYLLNLSRGKVVDLDAVKTGIESGQLAGAAVDVFPIEPSSNEEQFSSVLCGLPNVILTPHIGGSTQEAQQNIGIESASALVAYTDLGISAGAVNFPQITAPSIKAAHRVLNVHKNVPGVLSKITKIISETGANIKAQYLNTLGDIGYLIMDVDESLSREIKDRITELDENIKTRLLF